MKVWGDPWKSGCGAADLAAERKENTVRLREHQKGELRKLLESKGKKAPQTSLSFQK